MPNSINLLEGHTVVSKGIYDTKCVLFILSVYVYFMLFGLSQNIEVIIVFLFQEISGGVPKEMLYVFI